MFTKEDILKKLRSLKESLSKKMKYDGEIKSSVQLGGDEDNFIFLPLNAKLINEEYNFVFLGFDVLTEDEVVYQYMNQGKELTFFYPYNIGQEFEVSEDRGIVLDESINGELEESIELRNLRAILPVCCCQGDYIVVDLSEGVYGALYVITDGFLASILAPSVLDHVSDLIEGLEKNRYIVEEGDIIYPSSWYQRKNVISGKSVMDEFGNVD